MLSRPPKSSVCPCSRLRTTSLNNFEASKSSFSKQQQLCVVDQPFSSNLERILEGLSVSTWPFETLWCLLACMQTESAFQFMSQHVVLNLYLNIKHLVCARTDLFLDLDTEHGCRYTRSDYQQYQPSACGRKDAFYSKISVRTLR